MEDGSQLNVRSANQSAHVIVPEHDIVRRGSNPTGQSVAFEEGVSSPCWATWAELRGEFGGDIVKEYEGDPTWTGEDGQPTQYVYDRLPVHLLERNGPDEESHELDIIRVGRHLIEGYGGGDDWTHESYSSPEAASAAFRDAVAREKAPAARPSVQASLIEGAALRESGPGATKRFDEELAIPCTPRHTVRSGPAATPGPREKQLWVAGDEASFS
jgi:hypothetical protein